MLYDRRAFRQDERFEVERRAAPTRVNVRIPGMLRETSRPKVKILMENLSRNGFRCDYRSKMAVGDRVWLDFAGLTRLEAKFTRQEDDKSCFSFGQALHPAVMDHIIALFRITESR